MLREFIYVDVDKVRSVLAQIDGGVAEEASRTETDEHRLSGGIKSFVTREGVWGAVESTQRSLVDAVFPTLEDALTVAGHLQDVSGDLAELTADGFRLFQQRFPPGSFVRITGPARLFDVRYLAKVFRGYAAATIGLEHLYTLRQQQEQPTPRAKQPPSKRGSSASAKNRQSSLGQPEPDLEDLIPEFNSTSGGLTAETLRAIIRVTRGIFHPGLHVAMSPSNGISLTVAARLQEGRRFLDSEPDVLFARYGVLEQEWTLVGTIGTYHADSVGPYSPGSFVAGSQIKRSAFLNAVNGLLAHLGDRGLIDQPQFPGFSLVPFAVYRVISPSSATSATVGVPTAPGAVV